MAMAFAGTTQKCMACDKTVYLVDKLTADNRIYHKACFRCHHCKGTLKLQVLFFFFLPIPYTGFGSNNNKFNVMPQVGSREGGVYAALILPCEGGEVVFDRPSAQLGNYNSFEGVLYCRPHFDQLFKQTGSLDKSFEGRG
ncbi:hypothetical protein H5410_024244 [Solanum commersonii]|uniref:LIM zinc-binding domain-containing protein n=1 Tax=Solanum commersonii TaxID=4109 RepID=A0A9J5ZLF2_SOLCO|nr:hypothetical protein H5410_024244 [Solanum commersonii]